MRVWKNKNKIKTKRIQRYRTEYSLDELYFIISTFRVHKKAKYMDQWSFTSKYIYMYVYVVMFSKKIQKQEKNVYIGAALNEK